MGLLSYPCWNLLRLLNLNDVLLHSFDHYWLLLELLKMFLIVTFVQVCLVSKSWQLLHSAQGFMCVDSFLGVPCPHCSPHHFFSRWASWSQLHSTYFCSFSFTFAFFPLFCTKSSFFSWWWCICHFSLVKWYESFKLRCD